MPNGEAVQLTRQRPRGPERSGQLNVEKAVVALSRVWMECQLYMAEHAAVDASLRVAADALTVALTQREVLTIKNLDGELACDDQALFQDQSPPAGFMKALSARGVGCIRIRRGVSVSELRRLCVVLNYEPDKLEADGGAKVALQRAGASHIEVDRLTVTPQKIGEVPEAVLVVQHETARGTRGAEDADRPRRHAGECAGSPRRRKPRRGQ